MTEISQAAPLTRAMIQHHWELTPEVLQRQTDVNNEAWVELAIVVYPFAPRVAFRVAVYGSGNWPTESVSADEYADVNRAINAYNKARGVKGGA